MKDIMYIETYSEFIAKNSHFACRFGWSDQPHVFFLNTSHSIAGRTAGGRERAGWADLRSSCNVASIAKHWDLMDDDWYDYNDGLTINHQPVGFVWKCCVPLNPMVLLIIIPIKWLFHWEYTLFSDKPICSQRIRLVLEHLPIHWPQDVICKIIPISR